MTAPTPRPQPDVPQMWLMVVAIARNLAALGFVAKDASDAQNATQGPKEAAPHAT